MNGTNWDGSYAALPKVATAWSIAGSGDFNADGQADLLWQNTATGDRSIWLMSNNAWNGNYALLPNVSTQWSIAGVGDFNDDGKPDLVWQNAATGDRSIWFMSGTTWSGNYALLPNVSTQWQIAAVGDFNADGKPDLVWQNTTTGQRSIWFMNGSTWSGNYALLQTVPTAWRIAAAADFDGDSKPDLVWQNISTGERSIWIMSGSVWGGSYASLPTVSTQWSIAAVFADHATSADVSFHFCAPLPVWLAYQDNGGSWTPASVGSNDTYSFRIASRGGVAIVTPSGSGYNFEVLYATASELAAIGPTWRADCRFPGAVQKTVNVVVPAFPSAASLQVALGPASTFALFAGNGQATNVTVSGVPSGVLDLLAVGQDFNGSAVGLNFLRTVNPPDQSTVDMSSSVWMTPASANVSVNNLGSDVATVIVSFTSGRGTTVPLTGVTGGASQPYRGVPSSALSSGDLHQLVVSAAAAGAPSDPPASRVVRTAFYAAGNRTASLGPALTVPTISAVASSPYARYRMELARQSEYDAMAFVTFLQDAAARQASVYATTGYVGGVSTWDLAVPDLSSVGGFDSSWGLTAGATTTWSSNAVKGSFFAAPSAEATVQSATRRGAAPPSSLAPRTPIAP